MTGLVLSTECTDYYQSSSSLIRLKSKDHRSNTLDRNKSQGFNPFECGGGNRCHVVFSETVEKQQTAIGQYEGTQPMSLFPVWTGDLLPNTRVVNIQVWCCDIELATHDPFTPTTYVHSIFLLGLQPCGYLPDHRFCFDH